MNMRIAIPLLLCIFFTNALDAQKVKYKKGKVFIDKVQAYEFAETDKGAYRFGIPTQYALRDMEGKDIFRIVDSLFYLVPLPHEDGKRVGFHHAVLEAPDINRRSLVQNIGTLSPRKSMTKFLDKEGFFQEGKFTSEYFDIFMEKVGKGDFDKKNEYFVRANTTRAKNNQMMVDEFGPMPSRKPGKVVVKNLQISESEVTIGYYKVQVKGTGAHVFELYNTNDVMIGYSSFDLQNSRGNAYIELDESREWRPFKVSTVTGELTQDQKLQILATSLVELGYL